MRRENAVMRDELFEKAMRGEPLRGFGIVDCHCHMGKLADFSIPEGSAKSMIACADRLGIETLFVAPHIAIGPDCVRGNDMAAEAARQFPERIMAYLTVNPNRPEELVEELERLSLPAFIGIKLHPAFHGRSPGYAPYTPVYERADRDGLTVLIHSWSANDYNECEQIAIKYPGLNIIMAHSICLNHAMHRARDVIRRNTNIYGDLAGSAASHGLLEWFVENVGAEKILFGSDMPFFQPAFGLGLVAMSKLRLEDKLLILGGNLRRIFNFKTNKSILP